MKNPLILVFVCSLFACQSQSDHFKNKEEYLNGFQDKSISQIKERLKKDTVILNDLIGEVDFEFFYSFGFSIGAAMEGPAEELDEASPFEIESIDSLLAENNTFYLDADFIYPNAELTIEYPIGLDDKIIEDSIHKVYLNEEVLTINEIGLRMPDSILVSFTYKELISFDTLSIQLQDDRTTYQVGDHTLEISEVENNEIEFDIPIELYAQILDYRAYNADGILMASNANNAFPVYEASLEKKDSLMQVLQVLETALEKESKDDVLAELNLLQEDHFENFTEMEELHQRLENWYKETENKQENDEEYGTMELIKDLQLFLEENADKVGIYKQRVSLSFPDYIESLDVYIPKEYQMDSVQNMIAKKYYNRGRHNKFYDPEKEKYGLSDSLGNILIEAKYDHISDHSVDYYASKDYLELDEQLYLFDEGRKELTKISLPDDLRIYQDFDEEYVAVINEDEYLGLYRNYNEEVLPVEYDEIEKVGNLLGLSKELRGRDNYQFRTIDGKIIPVLDEEGEEKQIHTMRIESAGFLIKDNNYEMAFITENGVSPFYPVMEYIGDNLLAIQYEESYYATQQLINFEGELLTDMEFDLIRPRQDSMILFVFQDKTGFMDESGTIIIPPTFDDATNFDAGYAVVEMDGKDFLIDKTGNIVQEFNALIDEYENEGKETIFYVGDKKYNYKGEQIN